MKKQLKKNDNSNNNDNNILQLDQNYKSFLQDLKSRLRTSQIKAALAVNKELIKFYWQLGSDIIKYQKQYKWGEKFFNNFLMIYAKILPECRGFLKKIWNI